MKAAVDEVFAAESKSYLQQAKERDPRTGQPRIGTSFTLREDFYSAMWLHYFKTDYILGTEPEKMVDNMNGPGDKVLDDTIQPSDDSRKLLENPSAGNAD